MCLSKKISCQYFVIFCPALNRKSENVREEASKCSFKTTEVLSDADGHVIV